MHFTTQLDTSILWGFIICALVILIGLADAIPSAIMWLKSGKNYSDSLSGPMFWVGAALAVLGFVGMFFVWFPFSAPYNEYVPVSGIVQSTSSRFISDGSGGVNQRIAVVIRGQIYGCDDTRCTQLHKGSPVTLLCEKEFQWNATPGYHCNWGMAKLNG